MKIYVNLALVVVLCGAALAQVGPQTGGGGPQTGGGGPQTSGGGPQTSGGPPGPQTGGPPVRTTPSGPAVTTTLEPPTTTNSVTTASPTTVTKPAETTVTTASSTVTAAPTQTTATPTSATTNTQTTATTGTTAVPTETTGTTATTEPTTATVTTVSPTAAVGHWNVTGKVDNKTMVCILAEMAATFTWQDKTGKNGSVILDSSTADDGSCLGNQFIKWSSSKFDLTFTFDQDSDHFFVTNVTVDNLSTKQSAKLKGPVFQTSKQNSYSCNTQQQYELVGSGINVTMQLQGVKLQAYRTVAPTDPNAGSFSDAQPCQADSPPTSNIVPIAVGAALAGLVVIVIIAYLIGRRRNRQGYESV